ncbi:D-alanyl-D-alanine carboxypeptidase/D-alanyl-D-alanine-endopeptidase [Olivibacter sp. XZL3]|uniref:D-alanyl-D-alanine carboxypeptidase/D-alanyl-D-alanine endopeptidase n=1 Tax=Olivibacter sp. XZL3 TaxID=1735116 RepID=UPI0010650EB6|nr:D-alanyl-D-alanine carboxypeptidase/D-alanyl-D-alanine-endopeptidase [Olivibacter sp. XZL3]
MVLNYFIKAGFNAVLVVFLVAQSYGQSLEGKISNAYQQFERLPALKHGIASLTVLDAKTGAVLFTKNGNTGLATASTLKTITAAAAFYLLGADYSYQTRLYYTGEIVNGVLTGDIIIKGSGDPSLGSSRFDQTKESALLAQWTTAIANAGIKKINGSVIGDDLLYGGQKAGPRWIWQDLGSYYGAGISALNWRENLVDIHLLPGKQVGATTTLQSTVPNVSYLKIVNEATTGSHGSGDKVYPYSAPYSSLIYLRGTYGIDLKKPVQIALPDAAYDAALRLQLSLESKGISVREPATSGQLLKLSGKKVPQTGKDLSMHQSPALAELVYWFNQKSINLYGEALLKTMALEKGKVLDTDEAADVLRDFWVAKLGLEKGAIRIFDGSGLSPENRVTTMAMAKILASIKREPWFSAYYKSIPVYNGMKMKSGTIGGVLGYTGYQKASNGTELVFSLLVNNYEGTAYNMRQQMFKLLNALK